MADKMETPPICPLCGERAVAERKTNAAGDQVARYLCTVTNDWAGTWRT